LTTNYGISRQFDHPTYRDAVAKVNAACISAGKAAGILLANTGQIKQAQEDGFTFIAVGSDGGVLANGMKNLVEAF
jgi:2-keto-3-deoxy-L-rhamnonate aldolase RhmA